MTTLLAYLEQLEQLPAGTLTPVAGLVAEIRARLPERAEAATLAIADPLPLTWRERLWLVPAETRIGVVELAEALGRPKSWVYRRTGPSTDHTPLPCRKLDGELIFVVGQIRAWIDANESIVTAGPSAPVTPLRPRARAS